MHWAFPTWARFIFFWNLFMETCFCSFLIKIFFTICYACRLRNCGWCVIRTRVHWWMASNSQHALPPQSSLQESASSISPSYTQSKAQMKHPQRISWLVVAVSNATRIALQRYRLAEEERKKETTILTLDCFRLPLLKQLLHIAITTADWGRLYSCSMYF